MKSIITILLLCMLGSANAQILTLDSLLKRTMSQMIFDSLNKNVTILDGSQFEIVNKTVRIKQKAELVFDTSQFEIIGNVVRLKSAGAVVPVPAPVITGTNLLTFADQFDNPVWEKSNGSTILADQINGPEGLKTADVYTAAVGQWKNLLRRAYTFQAKTYQQTVYLKYLCI